MDSSQNQHAQAPTSSMPIQTVEISIQNLIKSWKRRQTLELFFNSRKLPQNNNNRAQWRTYLTNFLESNTIHAIVVLLVLADLTFTILDLSSSLLSCTPEEKEMRHGNGWYHWAGIAILGLLFFKTIALAVGLGISFFRRPGYVIDGVVLLVALLLEGFLERNGGGLLVVVSLWRVVRVVESAFELSDEAIEAQIQGIFCQFEALRDENTRLSETIAEKDEIIEKLKEECDQRRHS